MVMRVFDFVPARSGEQSSRRAASRLLVPRMFETLKPAEVAVFTGLSSAFIF